MVSLVSLTRCPARTKWDFSPGLIMLKKSPRMYVQSCHSFCSTLLERLCSFILALASHILLMLYFICIYTSFLLLLRSLLLPLAPLRIIHPNPVSSVSRCFRNSMTNSLQPPKYTIRVNDTNPIFFYCSAPSSCTKYGMVGAINPNSSTSVTTQRQMALNAAYQLSPGEPFPAEGSPTPEPTPTDGPDPTDRPTSTSTPSSTASPSTTSVAPSPSHHSTTLKPGAIAGIVVAGVTVLALAGALFFYIGRSKTLKAEVVRKASTIRHPSDPPIPSPAMMYSPGAGGAGALPRAYFSPKPDDSHGANGLSSPWSVRSHGPRSPNPMFQPQTPHPVGRSTSQRSSGGVFGVGERGEFVRSEEEQMWEKEAPVPLGPYGLQMYEK